LEKAICFEKLNPNLKTNSHEQMLVELNRIIVKVSRQNNIPISAFEGIYKDQVKVTHLFAILNDDKRKNIQSESNNGEIHRKTKFRH